MILSETLNDMMMNAQVAETLLRRGFSAPGSGPIDIFGVAAAVAAGLPPHLPLNACKQAWTEWLTTSKTCSQNNLLCLSFCGLCPCTFQWVADMFQ